MPLPNNFKDAVLEIVLHEDNKVIFTGSISLILQNSMKRKPNDIDCFTDYRYYGDSACMDLGRESSAKFYDSKNRLIEVVQGRTSNGIKVDYMYREHKPDYVTYKFRHKGKVTLLKLATVESINEVKREYIKQHGDSAPTKHAKDLFESGETDDLPF